MFAHAVSIPGNGHIRRELPCQDASGVWLSPRPCLIVCDGRGSASLSHLGARAAVRAFRSQCAVMEARLSFILDQPRCGSKDWHRFCQMMIRTVCQQKTELAEEHNCSEREFDFTIAFAIFGKHHIGVFQVGDGAITIQRNGQCSVVFPPDKGEFDNQTSFLKTGDDRIGQFHADILETNDVTGVAITSDGPEHLMFDLQTMTPGPIFDQLFTDLSAGQLTRQDILDYLTGTRWTRDPRGADDRSLAILAFPSHEEEAPDGLV
ncbi:MAG: protein phosphatase 2C domain-containing protein [Victivallales bacterium]|nr:protein phosphatase 2C domain-containing protein [Victivallales bacterium]